MQHSDSGDRIKNVNCNDVRRLLGAYEAGVLEGNESPLVEEHLLHCDECFEDLYRTAPFLYPFGGKKKISSVERPRRRWGALAATASVVLAVVLSAVLLESDGGGVRNRSVAGREINLLGPQDRVESETVLFRWEPAEDVDTYQLVVFDDVGTPVLVRDVEGTETVVNLEEEGLLVPKRVYHWKVMGNHSGTGTGLPSEIVSFRVSDELAHR